MLCVGSAQDSATPLHTHVSVGVQPDSSVCFIAITASQLVRAAFAVFGRWIYGIVAWVSFDATLSSPGAPTLFTK